MSKKLWTVFTIATTISIAVTSIVSFYFIPALALSNNNNLFFNNDWSTDWIKQCISSSVNSANINNNLAKGGSIVGSSVFASSNQPALYCSQQLQAYISQISSWLQQCTAAALTSGGFGSGSIVFANAITYCTNLLQLTQNNNFLTQNQINNNNNNNNNGGITTTPFPQANGGVTAPTYSTNGTPGFYTAVGHHHCLEGSAGCICTDPHKCNITTTPFLRQLP
jgi:hypothetical protein